jgi:hypothetical protein
MWIELYTLDAKRLTAESRGPDRRVMASINDSFYSREAG